MKRDRTAAKGPLFYVLLTAALGIWAYIGYRVVQDLILPLPVDVQGVLPVVGADRSPTPTISRPYVPDFRDPFERPAWWLRKTSPAKDRPSGRAAPSEKLSATPPPFSLSGVVGETALVRDQQGEILFLRRGDTRAGLRILDVRVDQVVVTFERRTLTLALSPPR